jgi:hypothetical protein
MTRPKQDLVLFGNVEDNNLSKELLCKRMKQQASIGKIKRLFQKDSRFIFSILYRHSKLHC